MTTAVPAKPFNPNGFRHEALFYSTDDEFLTGATGFIGDGIVAGEAVLVVVPEPRLGLLRAALDAETAGVTFIDMTTVGQNPARIIPLWQAFVDDESGGRPLRGVSEAIWVGRTPDEIVECHIYEALVNVAFAEADAATILCPYNQSALDRSIRHEAQRSHRWIHHEDTRSRSTIFAGVPSHAAIFGQPLPPAPPEAHSEEFTGSDQRRLRRLIVAAATDAGLDDNAANDLVLAVSEILANSIRYGGGSGVLRTWATGSGITCEVADRGQIEDLLAGRQRPTAEQIGGRGLWLANQLCDLVQIRVGPSGNLVRIHQHTSSPPTSLPASASSPSSLWCNRKKPDGHVERSSAFENPPAAWLTSHRQADAYAPPTPKGSMSAMGAGRSGRRDGHPR